MTAVEFGQQNTQVIILLHGGGLSWWNYRKAAALLAERYHVVLPLLDGHSGSDVTFTTIEDHARHIIDEIDVRFGGQVLAIGGLSLGGQIAAEILSQRADICTYALLESVLVKPMRLTHALIEPAFGTSYGLIRQRWFARLQAAYLRIPEELFEDYYRDTCQIKKADMITFLKANSAYVMKPALCDTMAKVKIVAGAKEQRSILNSAVLLHKGIAESSLEILPGLHHGELSLREPQCYVQMLESMWREERGFLCVKM